MNLEDFEWHDAILRKIDVDRSNPGILDTIKLTITWQDQKESAFTFHDVYYASLKLNFGVIAEESIHSVRFLTTKDSDVAEIILKWKPFFPEVENLMFVEIKTVSTASIIKIFSKSVTLD